MPKRKKAPGAVTPPASLAEARPQSARKECYDRILLEIRKGFADYVDAHPDRVGDTRWDEALECSMHGLGAMIAVIEGYDVNWPGTLEEVQEECRRLRATCADLRLRLEARELGDGAEEQGEDP